MTLAAQTETALIRGKRLSAHAFLKETCIFMLLFAQQHRVRCLLLSSRCHKKALSGVLIFPDLSCPMLDQPPALYSCCPVQCSFKLLPFFFFWDRILLCSSYLGLKFTLQPRLVSGLWPLPYHPCFDFMCVLYGYLIFFFDNYRVVTHFWCGSVSPYDSLSGSCCINLMPYYLMHMDPS